MNIESIDYLLGIKIALGITAFVTLTPFYEFVKNPKHFINLNYILVGLYTTLITGLSTFILTYPVINTIYNIEPILETANNDSSTAIEFLVLRFSSAFIGCKIFISCLKFNYNWFRLSHFKSKAKKGEHIINVYNTEGETLIEWSNIAQMGIYSVMAFCLLLSGYYSQESSILISLLNAALFFIVDDWNIIHDYTKEYQKEILKNHKIKIDLTNCVLVLLGIIISIVYFKWEITLLNCILILLSVYWKYVYKVEKLMAQLDLFGNTYSNEDIHFLDKEKKTGLIILKDKGKKVKDDI